MYDYLEKAYKFAKEKHKGQSRKFSKKPCITHLIRTYRIVKHYTNDEDMLAAALLHDVVEDTDVEISEVYKLFGADVAVIVEQLTFVNTGNKAAGLKIEVDNMSSKSKVVKLADRTANILGLFNPSVPIKFVNRYIKETEHVFGGVTIDNNEFKNMQLMLWTKLFNIIRILKNKFN